MALKAKLKKRWYPVHAPKLFDKVFLGEVLAETPEKAIGKNVITSLSALLDEKGQQKKNTELKFNIVRVEGNVLSTEWLSYIVNPNVIKVRRGRSKVNTSELLKTKDKIDIRLKLIAITRTKANGSALAALKKEIDTVLEEYVAKASFDQLVKDTMSRKIQREIINKTKKIFPIQFCEVRWLQRVRTSSKKK